MDWGLARHVIGGVLALGALLLLAATGALLWRVRGALHWRRSLKDELRILDREARNASGARGKALSLLLTRCRSTWKDPFPTLEALTDLPGLLHSIAACYHPGEKRPELCISLGNLLRSAQASADGRRPTVFPRPFPE